MKKYIFLIAISIISLANINLAYAGPEDDACSGTKRNGDRCEYTTTPTNSPTGPVTRTASGYCDRRGRGRDAIFGGANLYCNTDVNGWKDCSFANDPCEENGTTGTCDANLKCDTTKTPTSNPGGSTPPTCDGKTCPSNEVCVNQGGEPTCTANAATPGNTADNGTTTDASSPQTVSFPNPSRFTSITALIAGIINALLGVLGAITVAVLVASGFKYMTSSNPGEVGQALEGIRNAIVGLMIIMGSFLITQYVISALAGTSTTPTTPGAPTTPTTPGAPTT